MKIRRHWVSTLYLLVCVCVSTPLKSDEIEYEGAPTHLNVPRTFRFFSKGPGPEDPKYEGRKFSHHLDNVIQGGSIGIEMDMGKHMGKLGQLWERVRKYFPKVRHFEKRSGLPAADDPVNDIDDPEREPLDLEDLVGRGLIHPRVKPAARIEGRDSERMILV